ncbi:hypothetical protein GQ53DRAFT_770973 [Thozetella sp. PMI_491]|nr:hypothetical protein GQ53DRAFT_770973 [Thozetella sp. PMI_491]
MAMWQGKAEQDTTAIGQAEELFKGVPSDEWELGEYVGLAAYHKAILDSQAYYWFLASVKRESLIQWDPSQPRVMVEGIRQKLLEKLVTGRISRRQAAGTHEVTFSIAWEERMKEHFLHEDGKTATRFVVLTGSQEQAQAHTITQYLEKTWPADGLQIFHLLKEVTTKRDPLPYCLRLRQPVHHTSLQSAASNWPGWRLRFRKVVVELSV